METQCLADRHGNVVVVSTRDCSLQRRHQKLVEEAPAPFLTVEQDARLRAASKAILREAGYVGAGTCEFLVGQDGTISFLEVNTRLQVEHPVTEEVTGIDLVREMFRIADGEHLGPWTGDPRPRGHSIEFRINAEDPGRGFLPAPGTVTTWLPPSGPGVRLDAGVEAGSVIGPAWDSLLGKLIVTGATREQALQRAAPGAGRVQGRRAGHRPAVPPRGRHRPRLRPRAHGDEAVHRAHPVDRDRVPQRPSRRGAPTAQERRAGRPRRKADRSSSKSTASASRSPCPPACPRGRRAAHRRRGPAPPAARARQGRAPRPPRATTLAAPMQGTVIKVAVSEGSRSPPATWSSSSRR